MTDIAIRVENLGKKYKLGQQKSGNFRESFAHWFRRKGHIPGAQPHAPGPQEFWALKDVSFEIKQGEAVGIIGRNGAGKSTLLKILSRITEPTKGRFEIFGRVSSLLEVGTGFHEELTGRENVYLNGTILGMRRAEVKAKFDEIVDFSGVEKFIDTPVKHYSSGMKVRLAFAVAAHLEPEILIIDEVLAVGDAEFQKKCLGKMEHVTGQGRAVLFVSHNMGIIQRLCPKSILMVQGKNLGFDDTDKIISSYLIQEKDFEYTDLLSVQRENSAYGKSVKIISCTLLNSKNEIVNELKIGEAFKIRVSILGYEKSGSISAIFGIDTPLGIEITTVASEEENVFYTVDKDQIISVTAYFEDLFLNTGSYTVRVGLRTGRTALDLIKKSLSFGVTDVAHDLKSISGTSAGLIGLVKSVPEWITE